MAKMTVKVTTKPILKAKIIISKSLYLINRKWADAYVKSFISDVESNITKYVTIK